MNRSVVSEYLIFTYKDEDTTQPDSFWTSSGEIATSCGITNAVPTLEKLKTFGLVEKRYVKVRRTNKDDKKVAYIRAEWRLSVPWEKFCEEYFKYLSRGRKAGGRSKG